MTQNNFLDRIDQINKLADVALLTTVVNLSDLSLGNYVDNDKYVAFRSAGLSFIKKTYGENHPFYEEFAREVRIRYEHCIKAGKAIFQVIRQEIEAGWLTSIKGLLSAEIFTDFLEISEHLLTENYKDPAAVVAGTVLEEHLRQLCQSRSIPHYVVKDTRMVNKKAESMNQDLAKAGIYNSIEQKNVTAWLGIRNSAAHGHYKDYTREQVADMISSISSFIGRNPL